MKLLKKIFRCFWPTRSESSISELLRSTDQQDTSVLDSENNGDFIEVAQEM